MKKHDWFLTAFILILIAVQAITNSPARAQSGGGYDLTWNTLDNSGMVPTTGGGFSLYGSGGQADASPVLSGGGMALTGGFWVLPPWYNLSLPVILK